MRAQGRLTRLDLHAKLIEQLPIAQAALIQEPLQPGQAGLRIILERQLAAALQNLRILFQTVIDDPVLDDTPRLAHALAVEHQVMRVPQMPDHLLLAQLDRAARAAHADLVFQLLDDRINGRRMSEALFEILQFVDAAFFAGGADVSAQNFRGERHLLAGGAQQGERSVLAQAARQFLVIQKRRHPCHYIRGIERRQGHAQFQSETLAKQFPGRVLTRPRKERQKPRRRPRRDEHFRRRRDRRAALLGIQRLDELIKPDDEVAIRLAGMLILRQRVQALPGVHIRRRRAHCPQDRLARIDIGVLDATKLEDLVRPPQMKLQVLAAHLRGTLRADDEPFLLQLGDAAVDDGLIGPHLRELPA